MSEPETLPQARIVSPKSRTATVSLDWPVEFDGKVYEDVTIRRLNGREVEAFIDVLTNRKEGERRPQPPMIECPIEVYDALDDDDRLKVEEAMLPFLSRRLLQAGGSEPATFENTFGL